MKKAMLLMSIVLAGHCSAGVAATPVFQLNAHEAGAQRLLAVDTYPSSIGRDSAVMPTAFALRPALAPSAAPEDSLFHFLKNFRARPLRKPALGTMLLVGLCFLLYQIRRRPMRTSIGLHPADKPITQFGV